MEISLPSAIGNADFLLSTCSEGTAWLAFLRPLPSGYDANMNLALSIVSTIFGAVLVWAIVRFINGRNREIIAVVAVWIGLALLPFVAAAVAISIYDAIDPR